MSAYTTKSDVLSQIQNADLIQLTDDDSTGNLNETVLASVIASASGYIDRAVSNIYGDQLPFFPVPSSVASMALTITCYQLYRRRLTPDERNIFYEDYKEVVEFLKGVNKGDFHINDSPYRDFGQVSFTGRQTIYGSMGSNMPSNSM